MVKSFYFPNHFYHFKEPIGFYVDLDQKLVEVPFDVDWDSSKVEKVQLCTGFISSPILFYKDKTENMKPVFKDCKLNKLTKKK